MKATIEVVCYRSKVLADGKSPLMLRVTKDRKRKYSSIGISIDPQFWDFEKNKPRRHCPNRIQIEQVISDQIEAHRSKMLELQAEKREFTATTLHERVADKTTKRTVGEAFTRHIADLEAQKRTGYALTFKELQNSLLQFNGHLSIYFSDIDVSWLRRYEAWQNR